VKHDKTRKAIVEQWKTVANILDVQGEIALAGGVRYFAAHLPPVLTDRERLGVQFIRHIRRETSDPQKAPTREERTL
jgi:hypothetical protein